jgi:hypothetical protein
MSKTSPKAKQTKGTGRIAAAALREAAKLNSMADRFNPANTAEMKNVLSAILAAEANIQGLARRYITGRETAA